VKRFLLHILPALFFLIALTNRAQVNQELFLKQFYEADFKEKVRLVSSFEYSQIKDVYPLIEDTLEKIRKKVYSNTSSNEAKFLFEKIEANKAFDNNRFSRATYLLEAALNNHARNLIDSLYCLSKLRHCYIKLNNLQKAVEASDLFDKLASRSGDEKALQERLKKSYMYNSFGLIPKAIIEKRKEFAADYEKRKNDTDFLAGHHNDLAVYFNKLQVPDSAIFHLNIADKYISGKLVYTSNQTYYNFFKWLIQGNKALAYYHQQDYKAAVPLLQMDIYHSLKNNNIESAINSYVLIAKCHIKLNDLRRASLYTDSAGYLIEKTDQVKLKLSYLLLQAELYKAQKRFDLSAAKFNQYILYKDSVSSHEKEVLLINQQIALDIQRKDKEISEKTQLLQRAKYQEAKQKAFRAYLLAGMVILILLIVFLIKNNRNSKKREHQLASINDQIQRQNKTIETALREKDVLLREIHHRVKNNLQIISSIINIQNEKAINESTRLLLRELKMRISSIALTHQMLYQKGSMNEVSLNDYIQNLCQQINASFETQQVNTETLFSSADIKVNLDTAIPLGLLMNEIITNSYKHAFKVTKQGELKVQVWVAATEIKISIKDNGPGLPQNFEELMKKQESLGLELISILCNQINANLKVKNHDGAEFIITFHV